MSPQRYMLILVSGLRLTGAASERIARQRTGETRKEPRWAPSYFSPIPVRVRYRFAWASAIRTPLPWLWTVALAA